MEGLRKWNLTYLTRYHDTREWQNNQQECFNNALCYLLPTYLHCLKLTQHLPKKPNPHPQSRHSSSVRHLHDVVIFISSEAKTSIIAVCLVQLLLGGVRANPANPNKFTISTKCATWPFSIFHKQSPTMLISLGLLSSGLMVIHRFQPHGNLIR